MTPYVKKEWQNKGGLEAWRELHASEVEEIKRKMQEKEEQNEKKEADSA